MLKDNHDNFNNHVFSIISISFFLEYYFKKYFLIIIVFLINRFFSAIKIKGLTNFYLNTL